MSQLKTHGVCVYLSDPVQFHHHICGCVPSGSYAGSAQQHHRDPPGRHQDGTARAPAGSQEDQRHR